MALGICMVPYWVWPETRVKVPKQRHLQISGSSVSSHAWNKIVVSGQNCSHYDVCTEKYGQDAHTDLWKPANKLFKQLSGSRSRMHIFFWQDRWGFGTLQIICQDVHVPWEKNNRFLCSNRKKWTKSYDDVRLKKRLHYAGFWCQISRLLFDGQVVNCSDGALKAVKGILLILFFGKPLSKTSFLVR